ncbi:hypothetical protein H4I96_03465 [Botrytis cinerea]
MRKTPAKTENHPNPLTHSEPHHNAFMIKRVKARPSVTESAERRGAPIDKNVIL